MNMLQRATRRVSLMSNPVRAFGAGGGDYTYVHDNASNNKVKQPSLDEIHHNYPQKGIHSEHFHQWLAGRWSPDRDDILDNTRVNKYSAYYAFANFSPLQNGLIWKLVKTFVDKPQVEDNFGSFAGVQTSENGLFLYKSEQADDHLKSRFTDYMILGSFAGFMSGMSSFLFLPFVYGCLSLPRKLAGVQFFTFHAELLPHTEQVVFHKATFFGSVVRHTVDIKNLEKVEAETLPTSLMFDINTFDSQMIFRDQESKEVFVFDANGIWNADALEHPLLN